jgi:DNA polymerase-3 subunit gamma/tau
VASDDQGGTTVPYQALYRRFRPQQFAAVLGQEHVTRALRHSVRDGKVAHAYLFSGPRGTGKTSTARILAMALNCEHPVHGEPDATCPSCVAIRQGSSLDVQELDSATNRGIDEMRDLLSRVALGTPGRWKVYIIDEVHQMTSAAASALLKTLEDPPGHVVFVLATTDPQKVLPTIRSRTQHFEFRLLSAEVLTSLVRDVADQAALGIAPDAVDLVVRRGHGSARDALSVLDQVAAAGGFDDDDAGVNVLVDAIADRDPGRVLTEVAAAVAAGRDARRLGTELLEHLRNGFLATQARFLVLLPDDAAAQVEAQARRFGTPALVRAMEIVGQALIDMRDAPDPRITLEVALVRIAAPDADDTPGALLERLERLERLVGERREVAAGPIPSVRSVPPPAGPEPRPPGDAPPPVTVGGGQPALGAHRRPREARPAGPAVESADMAAPRPAAATSQPPSAPAPPAQPSGPMMTTEVHLATREAQSPAPEAQLPTREALTIAWGDTVLPGLRPGVKVYVSAGRFVGVDDAAAVFAVPDRGLLARAEPNRAEVEAALGAHFGRPVPLRLVLDEPGAPGPSPEPPSDDLSAIDLANLEDAPVAVVSPEQRLLEAFPGAEEVSP